jgi:hypothetical protein
MTGKEPTDQLENPSDPDGDRESEAIQGALRRLAVSDDEYVRFLFVAVSNIIA